MNGRKLLVTVCGLLDPSAQQLATLHRNGRILLGLPRNPGAFAKALQLYQPQRLAAKLLVAAVGFMSRCRSHCFFLPVVKLGNRLQGSEPLLAGIESGSCGVLLGSPEHRIRRAIASYRNEGKWEVAKVSFGKEGANLLEQEAKTLEELGKHVAGVPHMLGLHTAEDATVMRMNYLSGKRIASGESSQALRLLDSWISSEPAAELPAFPEWNAIEAALSGSPEAEEALDSLASERVRPVICHGDFARWNLLKQPDGTLMALDWEWGHSNGMPGIDLVHYFLQDARLVDRLQPSEAIRNTVGKLNAPACRAYLQQTGWSNNAILPIIACLAYKQGAGHQANGEVLEAALLELPHSLGC